MAQFSVPISEIVDLLGLERNPRSNSRARSIKVHCPFCDHRGYTMDVDLVSKVYHCFHCPEDMQKNTGALDLYSRVRLGGPSYQFDRKKVFHQMCEELGEKAPHQTARTSTSYEDTNIYPANDEELDKVYSALLKLPYLKLQRRHAENLMERGLPERVVYNRQFASLPSCAALINSHASGHATADWYWKSDIDKIRKSSPVLRNYSWKAVVAGVLIASDLIRKGLDLHGVPGFYHLTGTRWGLRYDEGMMIPTISYEGKIVGIQTRRDTATSSGLRYMTLSSKGLPDGVTANIARTHVVHNKESITEKTTVLITEGPLKADIILWFLTRNKKEDIAVIALQGVKNIREIPRIASLLRRDGVTEILSAFDMDKCGNISVAEAGVELRKLLEKEHLQVTTLAWDYEYALKKRKELMDLAKEHHIDFNPTDNPYADIAVIAKKLATSKIEYNTRVVDGKKVKDHWRPETKGYDDYLKTISQKG